MEKTLDQLHADMKAKHAEALGAGQQATTEQWEAFNTAQTVYNKAHAAATAQWRKDEAEGKHL